MRVLDGTRCKGKGGDGRDNPQHAPELPATLFHPWPAAAHVAQVPEHVGERSSGTHAGEWCVSIRASQRDMRISPSRHDPCGFPSTPRTRLSCPASIPRFCRSLLRQHGHRCLPVSTGAMSTSISLSRASPLELAHNPGRLGCILAEMRAMVRIIFTILSHFGAWALFVCLWLVLCHTTP